jgi:hypothetical protein
MKYYIIILFLIIISDTIVKAQIQKGAIVMGGDIRYSGKSEKNEFSNNNFPVIKKENSSFFFIRPQVGFFVSNSTLLGIGLEYDRFVRNMHSSYNGNVTSTRLIDNTILINPYLEKYISISDRFYFKMRFNLMTGVGNQKVGDDKEVVTKTSDLRVNIVPGLSYFITDNLALTCSMGQLYYNLNIEHLQVEVNDTKPKNVDHSYGFDFSFNTFSLGLKYYLRNKSE